MLSRLHVFFLSLLLALLAYSPSVLDVGYAVGITPPFGMIMMFPGDSASLEVSVAGDADVYTEVLQSSGGDGCFVSVEPSEFLVKGVRNVTVTVECSRPGSYAYRVFFHERVQRGVSGVIVEPAVVFKLNVLVRGVRVDAWPTNDSIIVMVSRHGVNVSSASLFIYVNGEERFRANVTVPSRLTINYSDLGIDVGEYNVVITVSAKGVPGDREIVSITRVTHIAGLGLDVRAPFIVFAFPGSSIEYVVRIMASGNASCLVDYTVTHGKDVLVDSEEVGPGEVVERSLIVYVNPWSVLPYGVDIMFEVQYTCGINSGEIVRSVSVFVVPLGFMLLIALVLAVIAVYLLYRFRTRDES